MSTEQVNEVKHITITIKLDAEAVRIIDNAKRKISDILSEWCEKQYEINIVPRGKVNKRTSSTVSEECLQKLRSKANELGISVNTLINDIIKARHNESSDI